MNNSTVNSTAPEASTNSTTDSIGLQSLNICVHGINFLLGLPTQSYITWLIVTGTKSGVAIAFFNLNLSISEIGSCVISLLCLVAYCTKMLILTKIVFLVGLGNTSRSLFQCLMSVERYLAVVHPVTFLKFKPLKYRVICCAAAWVYICGSFFCGMFTISLFYVFVWCYSLQQLLFLSIQLFCLVAVLRALKQSGPGERKREKEENHMKRRAFNLILISTVSMTIIYVPLGISGFSFVWHQHFINELFFFSIISNVLLSFIQPVLHLYHAGKLPCLCSP